MRQVAIDAASIPKDAKIAVLEKTSAESEKKIAEARADKVKQMSELQQYQRKIVDMDVKVMKAFVFHENITGKRTGALNIKEFCKNLLKWHRLPLYN